MPEMPAGDHTTQGRGCHSESVEDKSIDNDVQQIQPVVDGRMDNPRRLGLRVTL